MKTGTEVIRLDNGKYAVDLLDGTLGIFDKKKHAEEFIVQQNTIVCVGKRPAE